MKVTGLPLLFDFAEKHPDSRQPLLAWLAEVRSGKWLSPHELQRDFPKASFIGAGQTVFNIRHNRYRLLALISYPVQVAHVDRVGTHEEYDRW